MTHYPHLLESIDLGFTALPNRVVMGSMHTGPRGGAGRVRRMAAFYAERARGGVGLIVTGGIAPNAAGRHKPGGAVMLSAADVADHRSDRRRARRGRPDRDADPALRSLRRPPGPGRSERGAGADQPVHAPGPGVAEVEQTIEDFVTAAELARTAGYDGVEIMGSEGYLINKFLAARTNQRDDEWGGDVARRQRFAIEIMGGRASGSATTSSCLPVLAARPGRGRPDVGGDRAAGQGSSRPPAPPSSTPASAGTRPGSRRSRPGAARGLRRVTRQLKGEVSIPLVATNRINTPEVAEAMLAAATPTWSRWRGRSSPTPPSSQGGGRAAPTRSTPASPATRPASTTSSRADRLLPGQPARLPRDRARPRCRPAQADASPSSAPGPPGWRCASSAAERGHR